MIKTFVTIFSILAGCSAVFSLNAGDIQAEVLASTRGSTVTQAQSLILWDGEVSDVSGLTFHYGSANNPQAYQGKRCFEGIPDPWHAPGIGLNGLDSWRKDLSGYNEIWFYAKADAPGKTFDFSVYAWPHFSKSVNIDLYLVGGGGLTTTYKLVKIPIAALKTAEYSLDKVEILYFGTAKPTPGHKIYIDDIRAVGLSASVLGDSIVQVDTFRVLSNRAIKLIAKNRYNIAAVQALLHYSLSSPTDSDFVSAKRPIRVGVHHFVNAFKGDWSRVTPKIVYELFLAFDEKMKNGHTYTLTVHGVKRQTFTFKFNDTDYINGSVKVNHVGYLPESPKYGYVGNYLGSAGMMECDPSRFEVRDAATHAAVFSGVPRFRGEDLRLSGEKVFDCDFSALTAPGRYYLYAPGIGRTYNFEIGKDVFNGVYYKTARALFYQRCGMALRRPYADARWTHGVCHLEDAKIHASHTASLLYDDEKIESVVRMPGGWHDAGDYGKYVPTAAVTLFYLFTAYELFPKKFSDGVLNIPESGNGVPDILDEIKWEVDWLKEMQAPDGGVYFKVTTTNWPTTMPELDVAIRYLAPKTTHTTALYAASMAMAYRSFLPFWPDYARDCLTRAEMAWAFLERHPQASPAEGFKNPTGIGGGEYGDPEGDLDDRAWAAAELYKSKGLAKYDSAFAVYWPAHGPAWGWNQFQHHQQKASWAYATTTFPTHKDYVNRYKREVRGKVENELIPRTKGNIYRNAYRSDVLEWIGWGSFAQSTQYAWELIKASFLLDNPSYLDYAKINLDVQLGNNPQYKSYITGVGYDYPRDPLHHPSIHDGAAEPVPGIPVFGPHSYMSRDNPYQAAAQSVESLYPPGIGVDETASYPILRRYFDVHELVPMSEFTVQEIALTAVSSAFFSSFNDSPTVKPPPSTGAAPSPDFDGDGKVGLDDFFAFASAFGQKATEDNAKFDLDGDEKVDFNDFFIFVDAFGKSG